MATATAQKKETMGFQAEVSQVLKLMINSLYSNKEIFLRELISNASDACDKLRFEAIKDEKLYAGDSNLHIEISIDEEAKTITIADNGIGMTRDEVIQNIGTIARSGTKEFLAQLSGDKQKDAQLIGQFGVGFYSSFIVADKVTLKTLKAGADKSEAVVWESDGQGEFTLESCDKVTRGTEVTLHLKPDSEDYLEDYRLQMIIKKFSDHISLPIRMKVKEHKFTDKGEPDGFDLVEKTVNSASALWSRPKSQIKPEEYDEFYKTVSHDYNKPLTHVHAKLEGTLEYSLLLFIPEKAPFDLWTQEHQTGIKLYVKRVFIMDDAEKLIPKYLRFLRGIVDSNDLPLNVSREILQENAIIQSIRTTLTKRVLDHLEDLSKNDKDKFTTFWNAFGRVMKEGVVEDYTNREKIAQLCRFSSTHSENSDVTLDDYIFRMKKDQDEIYYIIADTHAAAKNSPLLEGFRKRGLEVLLLSDRVDHWFVSNLSEFKGKHFQSVSKGDIDLDKFAEDEVKKDDKAKEEIEKQVKPILERIKKALEGVVEDVRVSKRLTSSPACVVSQQNDMDPNLKRMMQQLGQAVPTQKPVLEINPDHALVKRLSDEQDEEVFKNWARVLFDQSVLADGGQVEDPAHFVQQLNELILKIGKM